MSRRKNSIRRAKRQRQKARARRNQVEKVEKTIQQMDAARTANPADIVSDWYQLPHPT
jgi:hypothetical protein